MHTVTAYNLIFHSHLPCPELPSVQGKPDVTIAYGDVPRTLINPVQTGVLYQTSERQFLLSLNNIARYLVQNGNEILVERTPGASDVEVRLFLLGSCLGALLHQRGILALHASAIQTKQGAVLFTGASGAGKSTLLSAFLQRGYRMLADDISAIETNAQGVPVVLPGYPQSKLWADSAKRLAHNTGKLRRVRPQLEKFSVPTTAHFASEPTPLHAMYVLVPYNQPHFDMHPLTNTEKFNVFIHHTYRQRFLDGLGLRPEHFRLAVNAAQVAKVRQIRRPMHPFLLDELVDFIEEDLRR